MMQANWMHKETLSASNIGNVVDIQGLRVKIMPLKMTRLDRSMKMLSQKVKIFEIFGTRPC